MNKSMSKRLGGQIPYLLEFHVSRKARDRYQFDAHFFSTDGNVIFADFFSARQFSERMNEKRSQSGTPELTVRAGDINAMGLIDEILHLVVEEYRRQKNPNVFSQAVEFLIVHLGKKSVDNTLLDFCSQFPPRDVYSGSISQRSYFDSKSRRSDGRLVPNRELLLEEMLLLWIANQNPALSPYKELFDDSSLSATSAYEKLLLQMYEFFDTQPTFGPDNENLMDMLQAPARANPHSLMNQLRFIQTRWRGWISFNINRLLSSFDLMKEEQKIVIGVGGEPETAIYEFKGPLYDAEVERFSQDLYWMPNLVLLAKNTYVWLDQLSRKYQQPIERLDQVPDEELAEMSGWGFSGLWLIGLWERSQASRQIKQRRGNPEAVASAYSLFSYEIAADLGGEDAYQVLREKAWKFGIRLASDMVPNHMGIDSRWMIEHPDWFIQLSNSPFPSYSFNGPDFSWDERVGLFIEDHYFNNSDAAVVFKRIDRWTGEERYIYHGNDGTSMPWNDTAQLNYLMPEVREAVLQTILHVARKFPIIRFDAAMTLAKRHYQRLWFPEPGTGGDIPSRAEYGMTRERFNELFPEEFWRMVVDRVASEAPDTLLLAEAFWLMEGYFVRTLGMHRVYNSAFMNMLRDEKNQEYRLVIKNTIEFDPQILKRYVNFMNNPDERTAVDQFGKGDKYFGICTMLATMPGLPMFGHGQIEGFTEKYGMEFRYPKWHENPDQDLVERHARQIFPLLRRRYLFAGVEHFRLYDFHTDQGGVNEDVFAFTNRSGDQLVLVIYNNRFAETTGWINQSTPFPIKSQHDGEKHFFQTNLALEVRLNDEPASFTVFRDSISGLEFIRPNQELHRQGLSIALNAYRCMVFTEFLQVADTENHVFAELNARLNGGGVPNIFQARREFELEALLRAFQDLVNPGMLEWLIQNRVGATTYQAENFKSAIDEVSKKVGLLLAEVHTNCGKGGDLSALQTEISQSLISLLNANQFQKLANDGENGAILDAISYIMEGRGSLGLSSGEVKNWGVFLCALVCAHLGKAAGSEGYKERSRAWFDDWLLANKIREAFIGLGMGNDVRERNLELIRTLISSQGWYDPDKNAHEMAQELIDQWTNDPAARNYLDVHAFDEILWFRKESFEELVWWIFAFDLIQLQEHPAINRQEYKKALLASFEVVQLLDQAKNQSGYQVEHLKIGSAES